MIELNIKSKKYFKMAKSLDPNFQIPKRRKNQILD